MSPPPKNERLGVTMSCMKGDVHGVADRVYRQHACSFSNSFVSLKMVHVYGENNDSPR